MMTFSLFCQKMSHWYWKNVKQINCVKLLWLQLYDFYQNFTIITGINLFSDFGEGKPLLPPKNHHDNSDKEPQTPFQEFLSAINPIDVDEWSDMKWYAKAYEVFKVTVKPTKSCMTIQSGQKCLFLNIYKWLQ